MNVPEAIHRTHELLSEGKEKKAWQKIAKWEKSEHLTLKEQHIYKMFKGFILWFTGRLQESLVIAEELFRESKNQNNTVDSIDALILKCTNLITLVRFVEMGEIITLCETMLKSVSQELFGLENEWRKALIWLMKGLYLSRINEFDNALKHLNKSLRIIKKHDILSVFLPYNLESLGYVYAVKGELDIALKSHKESLGHSRGEYVQIKIINAWSYHDMGEIYFQKGDLDLVRVKGKDKPVTIYELVCRANEEHDADKIKTYESALKSYLSQKWDRAAAEFKKVDDFAGKEFIKRCKEFKKNSPSKDWDGVWVMRSK